MNRKRIVIIVGIFSALAAGIFVLGAFVSSPDNFNAILGGIANIPSAENSTKAYCHHLGSDNPTQPGSCESSGLGTVYDYCEGNYLHKTYCLNDECRLKKYDCKVYCNGICFVESSGLGHCVCPS